MLRDKIIGQDILKRESVDIGRLGVTIEIREMTALARAEFQEMGKQPEIESRWALMSHCCYDPETGERAFTKEDKKAVISLPADVVDDILSAIYDVNGFGDKADKALEKNS